MTAPFVTSTVGSGPRGAGGKGRGEEGGEMSLFQRIATWLANEVVTKKVVHCVAMAENSHEHVFECRAACRGLC